MKNNRYMVLRENLAHYGPKYLTDLNLLSIITGSDEIAKKLLEKADYDLLTLSKMSTYELIHETGIKGMGIAKASQIKACLELGKRINRKKRFLLKADHPNEVAEYFMDQMAEYDKEHFNIILLDSKLNAFKVEEVSIGTVNVSIVHPREIFKPAIKQGAVSLILMHNHPSGDPYPSEEDQVITQRLKKAGELLGITVIDHIIIGNNDYVSFQELGLM